MPDRHDTCLWVNMMKQSDGRHRTAEQQELVRKRAVEMVYEQGYTRRAVARALGVSRQEVSGWCRRYEKHGMEALDSKPRGRKPGQKRLLDPWQCSVVARTIKDRTPDQLKLPFVLWTRAAVRDFIAERFGVVLKFTTMGNYLKRWGFTPQKPVAKAYERNPEAVRHWMESEYPAIRKRAAKERAVIYWGDETKVTNEMHRGRSYSPKGETPEVRKTGKKLSMNMISAVTNKGDLRWMSYPGTMTQRKYILFLARLVEGEHRKVFFIADNLSVHHGKKVKAWAASKAAEIELFFIPSYSPDLNPDEYLNRDLKANIHGKKTPKTIDELKSNLISFMRFLQKTPSRVMKYFHSSKLEYCRS